MSGDASRAPGSEPYEPIPFVTGFPLVDAEPEVMARRLAPKSWEDRERFFTNILYDTLELAGEVGPSKVSLDALFVECHMRIAQTLDLWEVEQPPDVHAARVFALSARSEHRMASNRFCTARDWHDPEAAFERVSVFAQFNRMSLSGRPGLSDLYRMLCKAN